MLARLEDLEGVDHAEIDHRGDFLRLSLSNDHAVALAADVLKGLGYASERASDADVQTVASWYDTGSVGDLSRIEASAIAERTVPTFALTRKLGPDATDRVRRAVVDALHNCFVSTPLASGPSLAAFRLLCVRVVEGSLRPIVGRASARTLAELVNADLHQDHRR
ncbi:MAG TPA: hypothetical protein VIP07_01545 [Candidatus Limnocylindria bacterium]